MVESGLWDPYHNHHGRIVPRQKILLSLTLSQLHLMDTDVAHLPSAFDNLQSLSVVFNRITDDGLANLLHKAPNVVTLDLEAKEMVFQIHSPAVNSL